MAGKLHAHREKFRQVPYWYLLIVQAVFLLSYPFFSDSTQGREALGFFFTVTAVCAVFFASRTAALRVAAILLAVPTVVLQIAYLSFRTGLLFYCTAVTSLLTMGFAVVNILWYVLRRGSVTPDKIAAAVSAYIFIAVLWAAFYSFINFLVPGAFAVSYGGDTRMDFFTFLYFSFTTLTTVGYGDIVPVAPNARALANVEQLIGIFYIALLIARLTGLYQSSRVKAGE